VSRNLFAYIVDTRLPLLLNFPSGATLTCTKGLISNVFILLMIVWVAFQLISLLGVSLALRPRN
jgi:hypothetical protein